MRRMTKSLEIGVGRQVKSQQPRDSRILSANESFFAVVISIRYLRDRLPTRILSPTTFNQSNTVDTIRDRIEAILTKEWTLNSALTIHRGMGTIDEGMKFLGEEFNITWTSCEGKGTSDRAYLYIACCPWVPCIDTNETGGLHI
jgi:hypothetical protein